MTKTPKLHGLYMNSVGEIYIIIAINNATVRGLTFATKVGMHRWVMNRKEWESYNFHKQLS